jgi:hypothetical protein
VLSEVLNRCLTSRFIYTSFCFVYYNLCIELDSFDLRKSQEMKPHLLFLLLIVIVPLIEGCSSRTYVNSVATKKEMIDGDAEEWLGRMTTTDKVSGLQVAVSNDNENLYLCIQSTKEQINSKILLGGLELWIDPTGKGKKTIGVKYPIGGLASRKNVLDPNADRRPDIKSLLELTNLEAELVGFSSPYSGRLSVSKIGDIQLNLARTGASSLVYEIKIPFRTFFKDKLDLQDGNLEFAYSIIVKGLERPAGFQGGSPSGMPPMGGPPGGGRPGGGGGFAGPPQGVGQMPPGQSDMFTSSTLKFKARLVL